MNEPKHARWLVALDLTEIDKTIVSWVNYLSVIMKPEVVYFVHVEEDFELPHYMPKSLSDSVKPVDESQRSALELLVAENFGNEHTEVQVEVIEGKPLDTLLHWTKVKKIDLFIAGRKPTTKGSGILPHKLSRKLSCSVLFIPELEMHGVKKIMVPIDFSTHSDLAVKVGLKFSNEIADSNIDCLHIYKVPIGFSKTGKSHEEFANLMKVNATREFENFTRPYTDKCAFTLSLLDTGSVAELIQSEAEAKGTDLVIMGSQGQSIGAFLLLGSTTEKFIQMNDSCLTLVVKTKDENIGFFEALAKI